MTGPVADPKTVPSGKRSCTPQRRDARRRKAWAAAILSDEAVAGPGASRLVGPVRGWSWVTPVIWESVWPTVGPLPSG